MTDVEGFVPTEVEYGTIRGGSEVELRLRVGDEGREERALVREGCLEGLEGATRRAYAKIGSQIIADVHLSASFHSCTLRTASS